MKRKLFIILGIALLFISCDNKKYCVDLGSIAVAESLIDDNTNNYCKRLRMAVNEDVKYYVKFLKLEVNEDQVYNHGEVLLQLLDIKEESLTLKSINNLNKTEKLRLRIYLGSGTTKTNLEKFKNKSLSVLFPKVKQALEN